MSPSEPAVTAAAAATAVPAAARRRGGPAGNLHLVGLLTFASGCLDAVTLMVIGGTFTSVITGNLIFVGRAVGTSSLSPALHAAMAVGGYIAGVAVGSRLAAGSGRGAGPAAAWPRRATLVLAVECLVLLIINAAWIGSRADPPDSVADLLLVAAALCLGMQGASARAVSGTPSTTYMTGALTALVAALATRRPRLSDATAAVGLAALVLGAACGALLATHAREAALLPALVAVTTVVLIKVRHHAAEPRHPAE